MTPKTVFLRRRLIAAGLLAALVAGLAVLWPSGGHADTPQSGTAVLPTLGVADAGTTIFGAVTSGEGAGETWAYRRLPLETPEPRLGDRAVPFGAVGSGTPEQQLAFMRYRADTGWQLAATPQSTDGVAQRGPIPNARGTRMTTSGAAVVVGQDPSRPLDDQVVVLARNPGGAFQALPAPPADVLLGAGTPAAGDDAEVLAGERGAGRVNAAVADADGGALVMIAPSGRAREDAVLVHQASGWTREPLDLPDAPATLRIVALAAASPSRAWLVASSPGRPVRLLRRDPDAAGGPRWMPVALPAGPWTDADAATAAGLSDLAPLGDQAQTLTPVGDRLWFDVGASSGDATRHATLLIDPAATANPVTAWCDLAAICDHPLGAAFSTSVGYRSFAWPGTAGTAGQRVVTNPLRTSGAVDSNRGTWLRFDDTTVVRRPGGGGNYHPSGAFATPESGWLEGPVQIGAVTQTPRLKAWPAALRAPLTAVAPEPGKAIGALDAGALAVGSDGAVLRYVPQQGWTREFLLSGSGGVVRAALRGVAWPDPARAHAVGDLGAIWQWRADTGLWERDPATPVGFEGNLMSVAFDPSDAWRGYAVGKDGVLLAYGKTWEQQPLPAGFEHANFTQVAFAGRDAIAVSDRGVLISSGGAWTVQADVSALLDALPGAAPQMVAVAGLSDGGAVLGGRTVVLVRDTAGGPWRTSDQPLVGLTVTAAAAIRDGARVRPVVSTLPTYDYPVADVPFDLDEDSPTPLVPPYALPGDGYVLRETATGWADEQRAAFAGSGDDRPVKADPVLAFALDPSGGGWAVGGWSGAADSAGRGTSGLGGTAKQVRGRVQTSAVLRYDPAGDPAGAALEATAEIPLGGNLVRFAIGGNPQCAQACADLSTQAIAPDRMTRDALDLAQQLAARGGGPRAFLSTGGRIRAAQGNDGDTAEEQRFAELLQPRFGLPVFNAVSAGDIDAGSSEQYRQAFATSSAPAGDAPALGVSTDLIPGAAPAAGSGARTHYAFDSSGLGGQVRVVVIDNSAGSLAESDPHQVPAEAQQPWLTAVLDDAKARGIPSLVLGSRDLNPRAKPALNVASDGDAVAQLLVDHGASAYFFDRPEENRTGAVPAGGQVTIPSFGTGTLGYRSGVDDAESIGLPDALFGDGGFLLTELDLAKQDPATNRVPVTVRLIPVIESLSLNAIDGTLLRRSRPSLFQGLGRRPVAGDRWGRTGGDGVPSPTGADPYTALPSDPCVVSGCSTRITPEYAFASSDPDVLDMVAVDPATSNQRKPLLGAGDKVISDPKSGLVCPFNAGTTTVTLTAGGRAVSQRVTVLAGSVLRPCGTRPLSADKIKVLARASAGAVTPPPPASPPPSVLPALVPPPPPAPAAKSPAKPAPKPIPDPTPLFAGFTASLPNAGGANSVSPPPPAPGFFAQPIPPGGATVRVTEEKRETEVATEQSQAYAAITADDRLPLEPFIAGMALIAALAGTTIRPGRRRGPAYARVRTSVPLSTRSSRYRRSHL